MHPSVIDVSEQKKTRQLFGGYSSIKTLQFIPYTTTKEWGIKNQVYGMGKYDHVYSRGWLLTFFVFLPEQLHHNLKNAQSLQLDLPNIGNAYLTTI